MGEHNIKAPFLGIGRTVKFKYITAALPQTHVLLSTQGAHLLCHSPTLRNCSKYLHGHIRPFSSHGHGVILPLIDADLGVRGCRVREKYVCMCRALEKAEFTAL